MAIDKAEDIKVAEEIVPEVSDKEQKARELGWKPEAEYEGDKRWVGAEEFLERQELYDGIHKANRRVKKQDKVIETLVAHNKKIEEVAIQKAIDALRLERLEAAKDNDVHKVVVLDEKIDEAKGKLPSAKPNTPSPSAVMEEFKEQNEWFDEASPNFDEDMATYANGLGYKLERDHEDWSPEDVLAEVAKRTKKTFEYKLKNSNRQIPSKVSSKSSTEDVGNKEKKLTYNDLTPEAQGMYRVLVKNPKTNPHGVMTAEDYLADYSYAQSLQKKRK